MLTNLGTEMRERRGKGERGRGEGGPTQRVEDDACFQDVNAHERGAGGVPALGVDKPVAEVLYQKREEEACHGYGSRRGLVGELAEALVAEHELRVGEKLGSSVSGRHG